MRQLVRLADRLLRLPGELATAAREVMRTIEEEFAVSYITGFEEIGRVEGQRDTVLRQLTRKFGPLPQEVEEAITALGVDRLGTLSEALLDFTSVADLTTWLTCLP